MNNKEKRVFLSSTFDENMCSYRKKIRNEVITRMNYFFGQIRGNFYLLDYELGIPDKTPMPEVLLECFDAISSSDIFIGIIGRKYGTILNKDNLNYENINNNKENYKKKYGELVYLLDKYNCAKHKENNEFNCSVLKLEFLHAINSNVKKFFYMPSNEEDIESQVYEIIELVKKAGYQYIKYNDKEQLCEIICKDLENEINNEFKSDFSNLNDIDKTFNNFYADKNRFYVKKEDIDNNLSSYLNGTDERPLIMYGPSGSGKSTCLTNWIYQKKVESKYLIIDNWVGLNGEKLDDSSIVSDILERIGDYFGKNKLELELNSENRKLDYFKIAISYLQNDINNKYIILIDGLNYLVKKNVKSRFWWLPKKLPSNVKMILTTNDENQFLAYKKENNFITLTINYSDCELRNILHRILSKQRKAAELESFQSLLDDLNYLVKNPLFINVAAREIILSSNYISINNCIKYYKQTQSMVKVFELLLKRLEDEYTLEPVIIFFLCMVLSRNGISLYDIETIMKFHQLNTVELKNIFSDMYFFLLKRDSGLLISYESLKDAVLNKYSYREKEVRNLIISNSFLKGDNEHYILEIIFQLYKLDNKVELSKILMDYKIALFLYKKEEVQFLSYVRYLKEDLTRTIILNWKYSLLEEDNKKIYENGCDIANLTFQLGEHEISKTIYDYIINSIGKEKLTEENKYILARCYNDLASYYISQNELNDAETNYNKAYELIYSKAEVRDENLAVLCCSMGMVYKLKKNPVAEQYYKKALKIQLELYGKTNLEIITTLNGLAEYYIYMKDYSKAKKYNNKALKIALLILDENHPTYAKIYNSEAIISGYLKDKKNEIKYSMKANNILINNLGKYHPSVFNSYKNLGNMYYNLKKYRKSVKCYRKSIAIVHAIYDGKHEKLISIYTRMGDIYHSMKEYSRAESYYSNALSIRCRQKHKNQLSTINLYNKIANVLELQNKNDKAEKIYINMLDIINLLQEFELIDILYIYDKLINIYLGNNNIKEYNKYAEKYNKLKEFK